MQIYNQNAIVDKLNLYLRLNNRSLNLNKGYCHGIALLWLYKFSTDKEEWFYSTVKKIVNCQTKIDFEKIELDLEKFLAHIEFLQNPNLYIKNIHQLDIDKILELPRELSLSFLFDYKDLNSVLEKVINENKLICISGPRHTIGVVKKNEDYHVFDPNYSTGKAKIIKDIDALKLEIIYCLFKNSTISNVRYPLEINVAGEQKKMDKKINKINLLNSLLHSVSNLDKPGYDGLTNLYLACESGDEEEVKMLLEKGADPNQACRHWTPLQIAALKGYANVVDILLKNNADPNLYDFQGHGPLYYAYKSGNEETINLLLKYGAKNNFLLVNEKNQLEKMLNQHYKMNDANKIFYENNTESYLLDDSLNVKNKKGCNS